MSAELQAPAAGITPAQRDLVRRTVAAEASDDELAMFLHVANKSGLDPLQKQIWFVKRGGRVTIQAGVDGLQARANREPSYRGQQVGVVCEKDVFKFDGKTGTVESHSYNPFEDRGRVLGAYCVVHVEGKMPFSAMARFSEFFDGNSPLWKNKPHVMIEKVARSTALRRAFPEQFGGIYDPAEMGAQAATELPPAGMKYTPVESVDAVPVPPSAPDAKPNDLRTLLELSGIHDDKFVSYLVAKSRIPAACAVDAIPAELAARIVANWEKASAAIKEWMKEQPKEN